MTIRIGPANYENVRHLLDRHYASARPARVCLVLAAFDDGAVSDARQREPIQASTSVPVGAARGVPIGATFGTPTAALIVAHPPLNARWRNRAWPGEYSAGTRRAIARRVNRDLRVIARVVVDPRWRGRGVGVALVRAYLASPQTRRTEAVAAMGDHCPIFERAGMRRIAIAPIDRDRALARTLRRLRLAPDTLIDDRLLERAATRWPQLVMVLAAWARASRGTRSALNRPDWLPDIAARAARAIIAPPAVFVADLSCEKSSLR